jgi:hypothetical protein
MIDCLSMMSAKDIIREDRSMELAQSIFCSAALDISEELRQWNSPFHFFSLDLLIKL